MTPPPRVAVRDLRFAFGSRLVLDGVTVDVMPGEFVSVVAASGAGKSTMFGVLTGALTASSGTVSIDGTVGVGDRPFGWLPQGDTLVPWRTVERNVALGLEASGQSARTARTHARRLLAEFGLADVGGAHPHQLSGGMRQRVGFARTVALGRDTLLLDEPFGALDALTRTDLQMWLLRLWEQRRWTILLITHDIREAVLMSDRVYVMSARPMAVTACVTVDLDRPRTPDMVLGRDAAAIEAQILAALRE